MSKNALENELVPNGDTSDVSRTICLNSLLNSSLLTVVGRPIVGCFRIVGDIYRHVDLGKLNSVELWRISVWFGSRNVEKTHNKSRGITVCTVLMNTLSKYQTVKRRDDCRQLRK